ncbi:Dabb family protein [Croceivirga thetidis]|uniref:Dabb family protein n=1 Tax=Croceivirga thetidis TaxID=2721623 RepID=A0ABX1GLF1_9FLAO|nr:Dabb family protein [Croceivirga thetidis]NKI30728.1 Dabb family protein [Croceivirga thetidis]
MKKTIIILALVLGSNLLAQEKETMHSFDSNFAHVVYFWFNEPENENHHKQFEASLTKFLNNSKYAKTNFMGKPPKAVRDVVDDSFTYNLIVSFESAEAQEKYQEEEAHLIFIEECKDLWQRVIVYDAIGVAQ